METPQTHTLIGRFQPMHNAHLEVIKKIYNNLGKYDNLVIAIGSSQHLRTCNNPLTVDEREKMIKLCFSDNKIINYKIIHLPDFEEDEDWMRNLRSKLNIIQIKDLDNIVFYSGNERVVKIFSEKNINIKKIKLIKGISASQIRTLIIQGKEWKHLVPKSVYEVLKSINAEEIIRKSNR